MGKITLIAFILGTTVLRFERQSYLQWSHLEHLGLKNSSSEPHRVINIKVLQHICNSGDRKSRAKYL